jgi:4-hydroxy-tetrahydrodipicolinate reductase
MVSDWIWGGISMQVIRVGDIMGHRTALIGGIGERLESIHQAHTQDNFAGGGMRRALWAVNLIGRSF